MQCISQTSFMCWVFISTAAFDHIKNWKRAYAHCLRHAAAVADTAAIGFVTAVTLALMLWIKCIISNYIKLLKLQFCFAWCKLFVLIRWWISCILITSDLQMIQCLQIFISMIGQRASFKCQYFFSTMHSCVHTNWKLESHVCDSGCDSIIWEN